MIIRRAYKTELDPNNEQASFFRRCAGVSRYVFNWGLAENKRRHEAGEKTSSNAMKKAFNANKREVCPFVVEVPYAVTEAAFRNLDAAFQRFFNKKIAAGYPKFKSKKNSKQSFAVRGTKVDIDRVRLQGAGWVRLKERGYLPVDGDYAVYAVVSSEAGRWFISVQVEEEIPDPAPPMSEAIGVDVGLKRLAVCSNGKVFDNIKPLVSAERKLARLNRELSRRKKGSKNREKTRVKLARAHAKVAHVRKHVLHNISYYLTAKTKPQAVVIEDLNVKGMLQNRHLSKAISDVGFAELRRQLEYKGKWYGVPIVVADRWYASSKTCSVCGYVKPLLKLSERTFVCEKCGAVIDRDLNSARNLASLVNNSIEGGNTAGLPVELACSSALLRSRKLAAEYRVSPAWALL